MTERGITITRNLSMNATKALMVRDILTLSSLVKDTMRTQRHLCRDRGRQGHHRRPQRHHHVGKVYRRPPASVNWAALK